MRCGAVKVQYFLKKIAFVFFLIINVVFVLHSSRIENQVL